VTTLESGGPYAEYTLANVAPDDDDDPADMADPDDATDPNDDRDYDDAATGRAERNMRVPATMEMIERLGPMWGTPTVTVVDASTARVTFRDAYQAASFASVNHDWPCRLSAPISDLAQPAALLVTLDVVVSDDARRVFELREGS
jgi:hypothetical protein